MTTLSYGPSHCPHNPPRIPQHCVNHANSFSFTVFFPPPPVSSFPSPIVFAHFLLAIFSSLSLPPSLPLASQEIERLHLQHSHVCRSLKFFVDSVAKNVPEMVPSCATAVLEAVMEVNQLLDKWFANQERHVADVRITRGRGSGSSFSASHSTFTYIALSLLVLLLVLKKKQPLLLPLSLPFSLESSNSASAISRFQSAPSFEFWQI